MKGIKGKKLIFPILLYTDTPLTRVSSRETVFQACTVSAGLLAIAVHCALKAVISSGTGCAPVDVFKGAVVEISASSNLLSFEAPASGFGPTLVPGRKRLMREVRDSDSESEDESDEIIPFGKRPCVYVSQRPSVTLKSVTKGHVSECKFPDSEDSEGEVEYLGTARAELSQSLLTSWLVPRGSRKSTGI